MVGHDLKVNYEEGCQILKRMGLGLRDGDCILALSHWLCNLRQITQPLKPQVFESVRWG